MNAKTTTFIKCLTGGIILFFLPVLIYWAFHVTEIGKSWQDTPLSNTVFVVVFGLFVFIEAGATACYLVPHIRAWVNNPKNRKSLIGLFLIGGALPLLPLHTLILSFLYGTILLSIVFGYKSLQEMNKENKKTNV